VLPGSPFLEDLLTAPVPAGVRLRQIHAASDAFCPPPGPIEGVAPRDYVMLAGGHSSLVVAEPFYLACREFFDGQQVDARDDDDDDVEYVFERVRESSEPLRLVVDGVPFYDEHDAAE